jgi:peroxiredoxin
MKNKLKIAIIPLILVVFSLVLTGCAKTAAQGTTTTAAQADVSGWTDPLAVTANSDASGLAPDFTGVDVVTGKTVSLSQFRGKIVLLNFVNYGCSSSVNTSVSAQLLDIQNLAAKRSDFIAVSVFCGCCPASSLKQFAQSNNLDWPWILDSGNTIMPKYAAYVERYAYPTLVFIDQNGKIFDYTGLQNVQSMGQELDKITAATGAAQ